MKTRAQVSFALPARAILVVSLATLIGGCDLALQKATGQYLKLRMIELCGEQDNACIAAVNAQFEACEARFSDDYQAYMKARPPEEEAILDAYLSKLFSCVVDKEGNPYFAYPAGQPSNP